MRKKQIRRELSGDSSVYPKVTGEPHWKGSLGLVNDYTEPRYVYENLEESTDYLPENGRIIGYRISSNLVIHSTIKDDINSSVLMPYINRLGGKLLDAEEMKVFIRNWNKISVLREKIGLTPLKDNPFWFLSDSMPYVGYKNGKCYDFIKIPFVFCLLVLKR